jgi:hypothetical protein
VHQFEHREPYQPVHAGLKPSVHDAIATATATDVHPDDAAADDAAIVRCPTCTFWLPSSDQASGGRKRRNFIIIKDESKDRHYVKYDTTIGLLAAFHARSLLTTYDANAVPVLKANVLLAIVLPSKSTLCKTFRSTSLG